MQKKSVIRSHSKEKRTPDLETLASLPLKIDLLILKDRYRNYRNPRKKVFDLVQKKYLFLLKRGHYLNLKSEEIKDVPLECLANTLCFPSYVSAEWAMQFYGLIPDRVATITSVTTLRTTKYRTPLANFTFEHLNKNRYPHGFVMKGSGKNSFLIARPDKALLDYVNLRLQNLRWKSKHDITEFIENDLRLDSNELCRLINIDELHELLPHYHRNSKEAQLIKWLIAEKENTHE